MTERLPTYQEPPPRPTDANIGAHAWEELNRLNLFTADGDFYGGMLGRAVMDLVNVFAGQGHSGMSAALAADAFHNLDIYEHLGPLTDDPDEWLEVADGLWQSRRKSSAFSRDGGLTYTVNDEAPGTVHNTTRRTTA